jgi:hypothetical protein
MGNVAALLFGRTCVAPINQDGAAASGVVAPAASNAASVASSNTSKCQSSIWANFDEVKEIIDGEEHSIAICKPCHSRLSTKFAHGTRHLLRHQK